MVSPKANIVPATSKQIQEIWAKRWGIPIITVDKVYSVEDVEGFAIVIDNQLVALITWVVYGDRAEIVSVDSLREGEGYGSQILKAAENYLFEKGVQRVYLITTNDNLKALSFYLKRGFRIVRLHLNAMERVREIKLGIPKKGNDGIPLRDMWELGKDLQK